MIPDWTTDRARICRRIAAQKSPLKLILKIKDDPILLPRWIAHHAPIVGYQNLIIADNESTDPDVLRLYERYVERLTVFRFSGFHNHLHDPQMFPEFRSALADSCAYLMFLDSDERLMWVEADRWFTDASVVERITGALDAGGLPGSWIYNAPGSDTVFQLGTNANWLHEGLRWGKPLLPADYAEPGLILHNIQYPRWLFAGTSTTNLMIQHLPHLSPEQRLRTNLNKLAARGFATAAMDVPSVLALDRSRIKDETMIRFLREIELIVETQGAPPRDYDPLPSGHIRFAPDGRIEVAGAAERDLLDDLLRNGGMHLAQVFAVTAEDRSRIRAEQGLPVSPGGPGAKDLLRQAVTARSAGDMETAIALFTEGAALFPRYLDRYRHPAFRKEHVRTLLTLRRFDEAMALVDGAAERWHETLVARAYTAARNATEAVRWWRRVLDTEPANSEAKAALNALPMSILEDDIRDAVFSMFPADRPVRFVQVGANDGRTNDPLNPYIRTGRWTGVLVEPIPAVFAQLRHTYRAQTELTFENCAMGPEPGSLTLHVPIGNPRVASLSRAHALSHVGGRDDAIETITVPVRTLAELIAVHGITDLDLLCIDAEGFDDQVLRGHDFSVCRPQVIQYEHIHLSPERRLALWQRLEGHGYRQVALHWNTLAVRDDTRDGVYIDRLQRTIQAFTTVS